MQILQILKNAWPLSFVSWHPYFADHLPSAWQLQRIYGQVVHTQLWRYSTFWFPNCSSFAMDSSQTLAYQQEKHCENGCILPMPACECKGFSSFSLLPATPVHLKEIPSQVSDFSWEPFSRNTLSTYSNPNRKSPGQENMGYPTKSPREESVELLPLVF